MIVRSSPLADVMFRPGPPAHCQLGCWPWAVHEWFPPMPQLIAADPLGSLHTIGRFTGNVAYSDDLIH